MAEDGLEGGSETSPFSAGLALLVGLIAGITLAATVLKRINQLRIAQHYIPPDVQIGGNGTPQPNQIVSVTFTPDQALIPGMEVDGEAAYKTLINGSWSGTTVFLPHFQFTFGGANSATGTIPASNWTALKVTVSSSLKQGGTVIQNDVFTYTY